MQGFTPSVKRMGWRQGRRYGMDGGLHRTLPLALLCVMASLFLCACGYWGEEKQRVKEIQALGRKNAVMYVEEKYGFTPAVRDVQVCTEREDKDPLYRANGYVMVSMDDGDKEFRVHINGERDTQAGQDDYQYDLIMKEAREYFRDLLGYEIHNIYMEYKKESGEMDSSPSCHQDYLLSQFYQAGSFTELLRQYPVNLRIDDCLNQDFTDLKERNAGAAVFFQEYMRSYGMKAVLISYKSQEDYEKGYSHTYGRGGLLDFAIEEDGMYIGSYAAFDGEEAKLCRFELQECEGMIFCCIDRAAGEDLQISAGEDLWLDLGETKKEPVSKVYSADKKEPGEIVVYIPTERYGRNVSVFIQHFYDGKWWQYEDYTHLTKDKQYMVVTSIGFPDSSFDFAVFEKE